MNPDVLQFALQIITALGGVAGLGALLRIGIDKRTARAAAAKEEASAGKVVIDNAVGLLQPFKEQVEFLRQELIAARSESRALRDDVRRLHEYTGRLIEALEAVGADVPPPPPPPQEPPPPQPVPPAPSAD